MNGEESSIERTYSMRRLSFCFFLSHRTSMKERRKNEIFVRWRNEEARDRESTERRDGEREITM